MSIFWRLRRDMRKFWKDDSCFLKQTCKCCLSLENNIPFLVPPKHWKFLPYVAQSKNFLRSLLCTSNKLSSITARISHKWNLNYPVCLFFPQGCINIWLLQPENPFTLLEASMEHSCINQTNDKPMLRRLYSEDWIPTRVEIKHRIYIWKFIWSILKSHSSLLVLTFNILWNIWLINWFNENHLPTWWWPRSKNQ